MSSRSNNNASHRGAGQALSDKIIAGEPKAWGDVDKEFERITNSLPNRIDADPENVEHGLAKLVLALIELIRKLLERQAIQRVEGGSLSGDEVEKLGLTLMRLEEKMGDLKAYFGLTDDDLSLNLGPLGELE